MRSASLFVFIALFVAAAPAQAQKYVLPLEPGDRIALRGELQPDPVLGTFVELRPSALAFRPDGGVEVSTLPYASIDVVQVLEKSRTRSAWRGALLGGYLLGAAGLVAGPLAARSVFDDTGVGRSMAVFGSAGAVSGAALGAALGALLARERWTAYRLVH